MNENLAGAAPRLVERRCGGWLAVSERSSPIKIGVTGQTEAEARRNFEAAMRRIVDEFAEHGIEVLASRG